MDDSTNAVSRSIMPLDEAPDLCVDSGESLLLSEDTELRARIQRVPLASFEALQQVTLIPAALHETESRRAITQDDAEALAEARRRLAEARGVSPACGCGCGCDGHPSRYGKTYPDALQRTFKRLRKTYQSNFVDVFTKATGRQVRWDDLELLHAWRWIEFVSRKPSRWIQYALFRDITIRPNARFLVAPHLTLLAARHIRIHRGGLLEAPGSYLKINATSVAGGL